MSTETTRSPDLTPIDRRAKCLHGKPLPDDCPDCAKGREHDDYHWEDGVKVYHSWEAYYDI